MNTQEYTMYQPTATEIAHVTASAARRHPELASRIDKAAALLLDGGLQLDQLAWDVRQVARWKIASQSGKGAYVVNGMSCPCHDARLNGAAHCKHSIAVTSYTKIMRNHLNAIIGTRGIDLGILPDGTFAVYADDKRMGMVFVKRNGASYDFVDSASMVRFSLWLAAQQPVAVEWPVAVAVAA